MSSQIRDFKPNISNGEQRRTGCLHRTGTAAIWFWSHQKDQLLQTERHSTNMQQKAVYPKDAICNFFYRNLHCLSARYEPCYTLQNPVHQCSSSGSCPNDQKDYAPLPLPPLPLPRRRKRKQTLPGLGNVSCKRKKKLFCVVGSYIYVLRGERERERERGDRERERGEREREARERERERGERERGERERERGNYSDLTSGQSGYSS